MSSERITVIGLQGSGKSEWAKMYANEFITNHKGVLIIDPLHEINLRGVSVYYPENRVDPRLEVEALIKDALIIPYQKQIPIGKRYQLVIFDEASRYFPSKQSLPPNFGYINDVCRHMDLSICCISRRLTQLATDIPELSHRVIVFVQSGYNDIARLNDLKRGLGDKVEKLEKYHFIELTAERKTIHHTPLKI